MLDVPSFWRAHQESGNNRGHIPDVMRQVSPVTAAGGDDTLEL
jgi:hypothetical protein